MTCLDNTYYIPYDVYYQTDVVFTHFATFLAKSLIQLMLCCHVSYIIIILLLSVQSVTIVMLADVFLYANP